MVGKWNKGNNCNYSIAMIAIIANNFRVEIYWKVLQYIAIIFGRFGNIAMINFEGKSIAIITF